MLKKGDVNDWSVSYAENNILAIFKCLGKCRRKLLVQESLYSGWLFIISNKQVLKDIYVKIYGVHDGY